MLLSCFFWFGVLGVVVLECLGGGFVHFEVGLLWFAGFVALRVSFVDLLFYVLITVQCFG